MTPQRVSLITLGVSNLERSAKFYTDLGWVRSPRGGETIVFYQLKGLVLGLFGLDALAEDQNRSVAELGTGAMTLALNMADRESVDSAFQSALNAGAMCLKKPQSVFWADIQVIILIPMVMFGRLRTIPIGRLRMMGH